MKIVLILLTAFIPFTAFLQKTGTLVLSGDSDYYGYDKREFAVYCNDELLGNFDHGGYFNYKEGQKVPLTIKHPKFETLTISELIFSKRKSEEYRLSIFEKIKPETEKELLDQFKTEQLNTCNRSNKKDIDVLAADSVAEFPGGNLAMMKFISDHVIYPQAAIERGIEGKVYITFIIETDGSITCIEVKKGADYLLDREAFRCVKSFPKFKPASSKGVAVPIVFSLPINFNLN